MYTCSSTGPFIRFAEINPDTELLAVKDDYLEIRLTDRGITENARDLLRRRFHRLLSLRQDEALAGLSSALAAKSSAGEGPLGEGRNLGRRNLSADFRDFLTDLYGEEDTPEINSEIELFNTLLAEAEAEEDQ